ncbi:MAG: phosphoribosylformylglycinamidine synthase I [Endomicrobium sp.]|jgi:phosphoribosylformylglycinamidine synthase|nr:phosphoribosylformylglycinamidine synthase I [Endomicrobium sp.]
MTKCKVLILRTAGTNCDYETLFAFEVCGAKVEKLHINNIMENKRKFFEYDILVFPGGFSYGDDIASGKILANEIKNKLGDELREFSLSGRPIIGICNGFQVLVKMGLLPDPKLFKQITTLYYNDSGKFECRWVYLKVLQNSNCLWTKNLPKIISLPVAHMEGKFIPKDKIVLNTLNTNKQIVFKYTTKDGEHLPNYPLDPNGSVEQIAGICNKDGNILGLMPHPERFIFNIQYPFNINLKNKYGLGKIIFQNAVDFVR